MDNQILFDLFSKTIQVAKILKKDEALMADFQKILNRLPPMQVGRFGQLQEWMETWTILRTSIAMYLTFTDYIPEDKFLPILHLNCSMQPGLRLYIVAMFLQVGRWVGK